MSDDTTFDLIRGLHLIADDARVDLHARECAGMAAERIKRLEAALRPFAEALYRAEGHEPENCSHRLECCRTDLTLHEFSQARVALDLAPDRQP